MKYLILLNRFDIDKEKLKEKIGNFYEDNGLVVLDPKNLDAKEIDKAYMIVEDWKKLDYQSLNFDSLKCLNYAKGNTFFVKTKFIDKIKISSKSIIKRINSVMKKENLSFNENGDIEIYVQFKRTNEIFYRIMTRNNINKEVIVDYSKFIAVIEKPGSIIEISDFLRLSWIFKIDLYIISENNGIHGLVKKAMLMTKGIPFSNFKPKIVSKIPSDYTKIGFSIKGKENEKQLKIIFNKEKIALVFGDEKFGLSQKIRDECDFLIKLTPESQKPLRASHAFSYVLGIYTNSKI